MKRRLLFLFAVFMVGASVGWGQMIPTYYKVAVGTDGDGSSAGSPIYKTNLETALSDAALSSLDSVIILLPEGVYSANAAPYFITKSSLAIIGEGDTSTVTIKSPVDIGLTNGGNVSFQKVHLTAKTSTGRGVVDIKSSKTTVSFSESKITIEGRGTGDSGSGACFGIVSQLTVNENTVNFINSRMYMSDGFERGLAFRDGGGHTLNFIGSKMEGPSAKSLYPYVIGICSWVGGTDNTNPVTYNIRNSVVDVNYYAIFAINQAGYTNAVNITIDNSSVTAWAALFLRGDLVNEAYPHNVAISNTHLYGRSYQNGPSDGFGTVVLDNCQNLTMTMDSKSSIVSENKAPIDSPITYMCVADVRKNTSGTWTFTSTDGSKALIQSKNDKYAPTLLTNTTLEEGDKVIFPEGEYTLPMTLPLDKSITLQGAGQSQTIVNGHIFVNSPSTGSVTLTASDMTLKGTDNSSAHGLIGMIGTGKNIVKLTNCKLDGGAVTAQTAAVGVRMESVGAELSLTNTDIDVNYYGIGLRNKEQVLDITGGTFTAWGAIMTSAGSMSPSDGTLANTNTRITAKDATFISRTLLNGKSNSYGAVILQEKYNGVTADFTNCELRAVDGLDPLINATQATATDIRSYGNTITFTGCTLSSLEGTNNLPDGSNGYLHAGVIRLGWSGTDDKSEFADNTITINNSTLNGKEGENWVYSHREKEAKKYDKLTINGTVYDPASGLICYGEPDIQNKIDNAVAGETISVPAGEHAGFKVTIRVLP